MNTLTINTKTLGQLTLSLYTRGIAASIFFKIEDTKGNDAVYISKESHISPWRGLTEMHNQYSTYIAYGLAQGKTTSVKEDKKVLSFIEKALKNKELRSLMKTNIYMTLD